MFQLKDLEEEPALLLELKEDVRDEAETLGRVTSVVLYDVRLAFTAQGLTTERRGWRYDHQISGSYSRTSLCHEDERPLFRSATSKSQCVSHLTSFQISATLYSGRERFRKSGGQAIGDDDDSQEQERLDKFAEWLAASEE